MKKILMLAGVLSCAMMAFSVQADTDDLNTEEMRKWHGHHSRPDLKEKMKHCRYKREHKDGRMKEIRECWHESKEDSK